MFNVAVERVAAQQPAAVGVGDDQRGHALHAEGPHQGLRLADARRVGGQQLLVGRHQALSRFGQALVAQQLAHHGRIAGVQALHIAGLLQDLQRFQLA
ncbi:hypothetical protein D9M69_730680 [compost metagenome]